MQQGQTTSKRPEDRSTEFVAVEGGKESASAGTLLVTAYLVIWALLLGFLWVGWRRTQHLAARLDSLEKALDRHDSAKS
ncbi:MAG: CcmD family protein [Polyangiaceae bacterium]|nr:CcmD family protein [Myxococcales bacterium]MCC6903023.1 CcmD family protein [Polyangiaceae bacterium]